jgi:GAF domain-containing protein
VPSLTRGLDPLEFARIAETLQAAPTPVRTAEEIIDFLRDQLDADHAGVTLLRGRRRLETVASTHPLVERADSLQGELDEGPCWDSSWSGEALVVTDLTTEARWPQWSAKVAALGISSLLGVELNTVEGRRNGSIKVYWSQRRTMTANDVAFVSIFARHAALALSSATREAGLNVALDTRKLIGQAQGILMERFELDEARAFEVLQRYSQDHNVKLHRVAERLVATRKLPRRTMMG